MTSTQTNHTDADEETCPEGQCDMRTCNDSFDHEFCTHRAPAYLQCEVCNRTESMPEREY